jgi:hypothetical protein
MTGILGFTWGLQTQSFTDNALSRKYERPAAWGTTGLPYKPAWVGSLSKSWGVWEGDFDEGGLGAAGGLYETWWDGQLCDGALPNWDQMPFRNGFRCLIDYL